VIGELPIPNMDFNLESMLIVRIQQHQAVRSRDIGASVQNPYRKTAVVFQTLEFKEWLPGMDSNHDSRLQRPLSYH
jgi:hypothetical protein